MFITVQYVKFFLSSLFSLLNGQEIKYRMLLPYLRNIYYSFTAMNKCIFCLLTYVNKNIQFSILEIKRLLRNFGIFNNNELWSSLGDCKTHP